MNKEIAHRLETTEQTIKFHINGLLLKLKARNRVEAVVIAQAAQRSQPKVHLRGALTPPRAAA